MLRELGYTTVEIELDTYSKPSEKIETLHDVLYDYAKGEFYPCTCNHSLTVV